MNDFLLNQPRIELAHLPTPLEPLSRLSAELGGPEIWIKRDDCTGLGFGGNKTRKLEFLLGAAREQGVDTIITLGGVQSNHARQTAAACARLGMTCQLVLPQVVARSGVDYDQNGNILLDRLFGAQVFVVADEAAVRAELERLTQAAAKEHRKVAIHPPGGSTAIGSLGYVAAAFEIQQQLQHCDLAFDQVVLAASTGGTLAGLAAGSQLASWNTEFQAICVAGDAAKMRSDIDALLAELGNMTDVPGGAAESIILDDAFLGDAYGLPSPAALEAIELCSTLEGILLDPVYTGKAMAALIDMVREQRSEAEKILFWHTGGAPSLFAYREDLRKA